MACNRGWTQNIYNSNCFLLSRPSCPLFLRLTPIFLSQALPSSSCLTLLSFTPIPSPLSIPSTTPLHIISSRFLRHSLRQLVSLLPLYFIPTSLNFVPHRSRNLTTPRPSKHSTVLCFLFLSDSYCWYASAILVRRILRSCTIAECGDGKTNNILVKR